MNVDVIRDRHSLTIRWPYGSGEWHVSKRFDAKTREMRSAVIRLPGLRPRLCARLGRQLEHELHYVCTLAETMDHIFTCPEDFDRVTVDREHDVRASPAMIIPLDDRIHIVTAP